MVEGLIAWVRWNFYGGSDITYLRYNQWIDHDISDMMLNKLLITMIDHDIRHAQTLYNPTQVTNNIYILMMIEND